MHGVALHLQVEAMKHVPGLEADLFARSAFNRYYYATFQCVQRTLVKIDGKYDGNLHHKSIPDMLRGAIKRSIKKVDTQARRVGDKELRKICAQANSLNLTFAKTLEKAYAVRVVADYYPDTLVEFDAHRFRLSGVSVNDAHNWLDEAKIWSKSVLDVFI